MDQPRLNVVGPREPTTRMKPKYSPRANWSYRHIAIANEEKIIVPPNLPDEEHFSAPWIGLFGFAASAMFITQPKASDASTKWIFLLAWVLGTAFIYWTCIRLKAVSVDNTYMSPTT